MMPSMADQPTPAEIQAASARLRQAAEEAGSTPGGRPPWWDAESLANILRDWSSTAEADAVHIALMSPAVGLAVADWLDAEVTLASDPRNHAEISPTALAVAHSLLGGDRD